MKRYFRFTAKFFQYIGKNWVYLGEEYVNMRPGMEHLSEPLTASEASILRKKLESELLKDGDGLIGFTALEGGMVWTTVANGPIRIAVDCVLAD